MKKKTPTEDTPIVCSFCAREEDEEEKLISGPDDIYICDKCIVLCSDIIEKKPEKVSKNIRILKPHEIKERLDEYVIGQDKAERAISVAVYNHYKRIFSKDKNKSGVEFSKSNVLLYGPTGS